MTIVEFLTGCLDAYELDAQLMPSEPDGYGTHAHCIDRAEALADIAVQRRIIERYNRAFENSRAHPEDFASKGALLALHGVVQLLASLYANHPDYDESWKF